MFQDISYALRWLARSPGFAVVAILSIGLGVGVKRHASLASADGCTHHAAPAHGETMAILL